SLPTEMAEVNSRWKPYRFQYELAQPVTVKAFSEGDAITHEGANQITVGAGVVVREEVNPVDGGDGYFYINGVTSSAYTVNRVSRFNNVYKDNDIDYLWAFTFRVTSNGSFAKISERLYQEAAYSVTYFVL